VQKVRLIRLRLSLVAEPSELTVSMSDASFGWTSAWQSFDPLGIEHPDLGWINLGEEFVQGAAGHRAFAFYRLSYPSFAAELDGAL
jgi:hypothetical protein